MRYGLRLVAVDVVVAADVGVVGGVGFVAPVAVVGVVCVVVGDDEIGVGVVVMAEGC